jgi:hypothetical protein
VRFLFPGLFLLEDARNIELLWSGKYVFYFLGYCQRAPILHIHKDPICFTLYQGFTAGFADKFIFPQ